jgi:putative folate metabolism gamma-glutamate ligase
MYTKDHEDIFKTLDRYINDIPEGSVLAITSKIVSISEGRVVSAGSVTKDELVREESDLYLDSKNENYGMILTVKDNILIPNAGIDESNGNGNLILWPKDPQKSANAIRGYLAAKFNLKNFGIIITDSKTVPLRWGVTGIAIAYSGIKPLNDYIGREDIFKRKMMATKVNVIDALAAAAVLVMGEGDEQIPMVMISELPFVTFNSKDPSPGELDALDLDINDDLYGPIFCRAKWQEGRRGGRYGSKN